MELRVLHFLLSESIMKLAKMHSNGSEFTKLCEQREFHFQSSRFRVNLLIYHQHSSRGSGLIRGKESDSAGGTDRVRIVEKADLTWHVLCRRSCVHEACPRLFAGVYNVTL